MEHFVTSKKLIKEFIKLHPQKISKLYIAENATGNDVKEVINLAKSKNISFLSVPKQKILSIFNQGYSGMLLILSSVRYYTLEELINKLEKQKKSIVVILDEINNPQNFGSILRTSSAFEVDGIIIQQWNQVQITQTVIDTSRGGVYNVPIVKVKNVYNAVKELKKHNFWIYSTMPPQNNPQLNIITDFKSICQQERICIILGNENKGVRKNLISESDGIITIKHSNKIQSLNVSVICGIILYELYSYRY
ncbi:MAG: 23S rRNA (guanosine(2251)-2'-O)-methyltransferase RlmB [Endomicrobia bacterium]|nr:23S rRNA (guanosine(2251)-2'-O)-methyltransferase RlmB [Endomicrobiia bacterium]